MNKIQTFNLLEGMVIAENIYSENKELLVPKNVVVTQNIVLLLTKENIPYAYVEDEMVEKKDIIQSSYISRVKHSKEFFLFQRNYEKNVAYISKAMNELIEKNIPFEIDQFLVNILSLLENTGQASNILDFLVSMRDYDDSTFCHSINVALLCGLFSDWLHLSTAQKEIAILCGLFHDIGKLKIPLEIIQKPGALSYQEFEIMKKHTEYGFHILSRKELDRNMSIHVKNAALMHHEKCDGSGYPLGLKAPKIDFYAKMVAIVDVYDAMTSARVYRKPLCPFAVIKHFEEEGLKKYDPELLLVFLDHVVNTYINHTVQLSNGKIGNIIFINKVTLSKPTVKCNDEFVDLSKSDNVFIKNIL